MEPSEDAPRRTRSAWYVVLSPTRGAVPRAVVAAATGIATSQADPWVGGLLVAAALIVAMDGHDRNGPGSLVRA